MSIWVTKYETNCPNPIPAGFSTFGYVPRVPTYFVANFSMQYKFMQHDKAEAAAFLNISNVFNREPPWNEAAPGQLFIFTVTPAEYDTVGTYLRAGVRFRL